MAAGGPSGSKPAPLRYPVPTDLCVGLDGTGKPFLPASVLLGVFDHYSTYKIAEVSAARAPAPSQPASPRVSVPTWHSPNHTRFLPCRAHQCARNASLPNS